MKCPRCDRPLIKGKARCLYCGASAHVAAGPEPPPVPDSEHECSSPHAEKATFRLDDLPEELRQQIRQALQSTQANTLTGESAGAAPTAAPVEKAAGTDRLDRVVKSLESIRENFDSDRIDYDEYHELVLQTLKRFLEDLGLSAALAFVLNELKSSALTHFVDDSIYKTLCGKLLAAAVPPVEKPKPWSFGLFRKKRKL